VPAPLTQDDLTAYGDLLSEITARVEQAASLLNGVTMRFELEAAAPQFRKAIELVVLSTFVVNRKNPVEITTKLGSHKWNKAMRLVERVNPNYWPEPFVARVGGGDVRKLKTLTGPNLTKGDAGRT